jgi:hypothetical protein
MGDFRDLAPMSTHQHPEVTVPKTVTDITPAIAFRHVEAFE